MRREHGHREGAAHLGPHRAGGVEAGGVEPLAVGWPSAEAPGRAITRRQPDQFGVGGALEPRAGRAQLVAQLARVHQVAVLADGDARDPGRADQRLRVLPARRARGRVAHVPDGRLAAEAGEGALVEDLRDQSHVPDGRDLAVIGHGDAGALLAAVLQRVKAEEGQARDVEDGSVDGKHTAHLCEVPGRAAS